MSEHEQCHEHTENVSSKGGDCCGGAHAHGSAKPDAHVALPGTINTQALPADHPACTLMGLLRRELDGPGFPDGGAMAERYAGCC